MISFLNMIKFILNYWLVAEFAVSVNEAPQLYTMYSFIKDVVCATLYSSPSSSPFFLSPRNFTIVSFPHQISCMTIIANAISYHTSTHPAIAFHSVHSLNPKLVSSPLWALRTCPCPIFTFAHNRPLACDSQHHYRTIHPLPWPYHTTHPFTPFLSFPFPRELMNVVCVHRYTPLVYFTHLHYSQKKKRVLMK